MPGPAHRPHPIVWLILFLPFGATKYNALASLSNMPISYMTTIDGYTSDRWGADAMLLVDAASEVIAVTIFLTVAWVLLQRAHQPPQTVG